jgi:SAM-dependent methyltransferase
MNAALTRLRRIHARAVVGRVENLAIAAGERLLPPSSWCPCCGWRGLFFRTFVVVEYLRHNAICPGCGALERHRALSRFYPRFFGSLDHRPRRLIHFAPEVCLRPVLETLVDRYETSAYGESYPADHRLDLTRLELPNESCDVFVLNHVLDSMGDDRAAVREMFRSLRPGGIVLAVVTLEFGVPSRDFPPRKTGHSHTFGTVDLAQRFAPFDVQVADAVEGFTPAERGRAGLPRQVPVVVMRKPRGPRKSNGSA